jgi:hypothetical protein
LRTISAATAADEVGFLEQRAGGDDRPGDLDFVERQHVDDRRGTPFGARQLVGEAAADVALGADHQTQEDGIQQRLDLVVGGDLAGIASLAQVDDAQQEALAVRRSAASGEFQQAFAAHRDAQPGPPFCRQG